MTLRRPAAAVTIDGQELSLPESATAALTVVATTTGAHDQARLTLGPGSPALEIEPTAKVEISLGYGDTLRPVFTGAVARVAHQPWGTEVEALAVTAAMDTVRIGRAYVSRTAGDIAKDLAGEAGASAGDIENGPTLPVFYVDENRSAWHHLRRLARLTAAELTSAPDGGVNLRAVRSGSADHTLRAGADLLAWAVGGQRQPAIVPPTGPYSAAGEQGTEAWSLVHHDPGGSGAHRVHPVLRDREIAELVDAATSAASDRATKDGWVIVTGDPAIRAGDLVELESVQRAEGSFRVVSAGHEIDIDGFRTTLRLEGAA